MTSNATKRLIADLNRNAADQRAKARAAYEAEVARIDAAASALVAEYIAADDPEQAKADFLAVNGPDAPEPGRWPGPAAILPTGARMNPRKPEAAEYFDREQVAYIVAPDGSDKATRVITSFGSPLGWNVGTIHALRHDQTFASLGFVRVVGVIEYASGFEVGDVPNRSLSHSVFK